MIEEEKNYEQICKKNIDLIKEIYKNKFALESNYFKLENIINEIENYVSKIDEAEKNKIEIIFTKELNDLNEEYVLYILSFLVKFYKKTEYLNEMFEITLNSKALKNDTKYFIFGQLNYVISTIKDIEAEDTLKLQSKLYEHIVEKFSEEIGSRSFIPKEERNENFIIVFTSQMLGIGHGPTKTALDRCYSLITHLNKKIMLINTNDLLSDKGTIPIHNTVIANADDNINNISYKDITIPFYKTKNKMPDVREYINIVNVVKKYKPYLIFSIGDKCIISDICKQIVPTATICLEDRMPIAKSDFIVPFGDNVCKSNDKRIIYKNDNSFYEETSKKLLENGQKSMDAQRYFAEIYIKIISNSLFK